jgi:sugar phosphate isomerase/epimerase
MKLACATSTFQHDEPQEAFAKIADIGFRYIELSSPHCDYNALTNALIDNVAYEIQQAGLEVVAYCPVDAQDNWTRMPRMFEVAKRVGATYVVVPCANLSRAKELEPLCDKFGIDLAIENMWPFPFGRPSDYGSLNGTVGPRIGAGPDLGWFAAGGQDPLEIFAAAGDRVKVVHLEDVEAEGSHRPVEFGDGVAPLEPFMAELAARGFGGPVTIAHDPLRVINFEIGVFGDATYEVAEVSVSDQEIIRRLQHAREWALARGAVE